MTYDSSSAANGILTFETRNIGAAWQWSVVTDMVVVENIWLLVNMFYFISFQVPIRDFIIKLLIG